MAAITHHHADAYDEDDELPGINAGDWRVNRYTDDDGRPALFQYHPKWLPDTTGGDVTLAEGFKLAFAFFALSTIVAVLRIAWHVRRMARMRQSRATRTGRSQDEEGGAL